MLKILNYKHLFFFLLIIGQMLIYNYPYIVQIEPRNVHAWRQFDCLSFAQGFYNNRSNFLEPRLNNLGNNDGRAVSDFPVVQMLVGNIWKLTGVQTWIYRMINVVFLFFGLFFIYRLFLKQFKNKIFAALIAALIFTSPNLSYYGISTISDIQSFSLSMVGLYFFLNWVKLKIRKDLIRSLLLFSFALLLKPSAAFIYILCMLYFLFDLMEQKNQRANLIGVKNILRIALILFPLVICFIWFQYANSYNLKNNSGFFLVGIFPIWELKNSEVLRILSAFIYDILPQIIHPIVLFLVCLFILANSFFNFKKQKTASIILIALFVLFIVYVLLFFGAMDVHDYYLINMTGVLVVALFFIFKVLGDHVFLKNTRIVLFVLSFFVILNSWSSGSKTWINTNSNVKSYENSILYNSTQEKRIFWIYWLDRSKFQSLENNLVDFTKFGISNSDTVFCLGDETINRSLYLLNRVGYSNYNTSVENVPLFLSTHKSVKYVFLLDGSLKSNKKLEAIFSNKIYDKDGLSVYKIINI